MTLRIDKPPFLQTVDLIAAVLALYLIIRPSWRRVLVGVGAIVAGGLLGWFIVWLTNDVFDVFGVGLTPVTTMWVAVGFAGIALGAVNFYKTRWWRKVVAGVVIPVFVLAAFAGINVDFGEYRNLNDALGIVPYGALSLHHEHGQLVNAGTDYAATASPSHIPKKGEVGKVTIPATRSGFAARGALVYLPPVALTKTPPVLPVLYAFAGQPGAPADVFGAGALATQMDAFAASHGGYAPIVVAADQLGGPGRNPMCINSAAYGDSATYLLQDVRNWITTHLRVSTDPSAWGVFGYSQGATCAVQFATQHPELFGSALASSSELGPTLGSKEVTIATVFGGSAAAFQKAQPASVMASRAPYKNTLIVLGVGQNDAKYTAFAKKLYADATSAGIRAQLLISPGTAHDWHTVRYTLTNGFPLIAAQMGLTG